MTTRITAAVLAALLAAAAPAAVLTTPATAVAQVRNASAEQFVQTEAQAALRTLNDRGLSMSAKRASFRRFVDTVADVPKITRFVLGKYARTVTPQQYAAFAGAFRVYANQVYESRLGAYSGESFRVSGSQSRSPTDVIVTSQVVGGAKNRQENVTWRVQRAADGRWRVVDVNVAGVWLAITQQQDFVSTLDNNRGDINVLIAQLQGRA